MLGRVIRRVGASVLMEAALSGESKRSSRPWQLVVAVPDLAMLNADALGMSRSKTEIDSLSRSLSAPAGVKSTRKISS